MKDSSASNVLQLAFAAHRMGQLADAERLYRQVLADEPRNFDALRFLGTVLGARGDLPAGIKHLRDALKQRPKSAEAHRDLGALQQASGSLAAAASSFETAIGLDPLDYGAHHNLGIVRREQGRLPEAAACFGAAIGINPEFSDGWLNLGVTWQAQGRFDGAVVAFRAAIRSASDPAPIYCALGRLLFEMDKVPEAVDAFRKVLESKPDSPEALNGLARALVDVDEDAALETIERAIKSIPDNIYGYNVLGTISRKRGRFDECLKAYETALTIPGNHAETYYGLSRSRKMSVTDGTLIDCMKEELDRLSATLSDWDKSFFHFALGKALDDLDRCEEAIRHFDLANKLYLEGRPPYLKATTMAVERQRMAAEIDALIRGFRQPEIARLQKWGNPSERPILIVGMIRSGTTLVEQILASHPDVAAGGELHYLSYWCQQVGITQGAPLTQTDMERAIRGYLEVLDYISPDARRVTDKMPINFLFLGPIHAMFPNARIIHCRRHPVDNALSMYFERFARGQDFSYERAGIVAVRKEYRRLMAHWHRVLPSDRLFDLDYQALVDDQEATTRRLLEFCGLDWNEACLSFYNTRRSVHTASDWQVRQPIYRTSLERWRRYEPWLGEFRELLAESD